MPGGSTGTGGGSEATGAATGTAPKSVGEVEENKWGKLSHEEQQASIVELKMFALEKGLNIWRGKGLIFVFTQANDYRKFQVLMHRTDPGQSAGMCHSFNSGIVHIAFYRQPDELTFAHVLVHESVHGFLHRYRKPSHVPSWANEGLAEVIAAELVPNPQYSNLMTRSARAGIERMGGVDAGFFFG